MWLIDDPDKYRTYRIGRRDERGNYLPAINLGIPIEGAGDNDAERAGNTKRNREIAEDVLRRFQLLGNGVSPLRRSSGGCKKSSPELREPIAEKPQRT